MPLASAFLLFSLLGSGLAALVNRTIDDQYGDSITGATPVYAPKALWTQGALCQSCGAQPDPTMVFNRTWHDSTYTVEDGQQRTITISFNGSAIYVFFLTVPKKVYISETHLNITLDGNKTGVFNFVPSPSDGYRYNVLVYNNSKLPSRQHTIVLSTGGNTSAVLEFDYAVYSTEDGKRPQPVGAIVGGTIGGIVVVFILILLCRRRSLIASSATGVNAEEDNALNVDENKEKKETLRQQLEELKDIQRNSRAGLA